MTTGFNAGYYELPNTGVLSAIQDAEDNAEKECLGLLQLVDLEVKIEQVGGCNPTTVTATFVCQ